MRSPYLMASGAPPATHVLRMAVQEHLLGVACIGGEPLVEPLVEASELRWAEPSIYVKDQGLEHRNPVVGVPRALAATLTLANQRSAAHGRACRAGRDRDAPILELPRRVAIDMSAVDPMRIASWPPDWFSEGRLSP